MINAGTRLDDRYVLVDLVGRGRLGEVWRADDTTLDRVVAVKVLPASLFSDPDSLAQLRARARAIAGLSDPNIVEVYDYGQADGIVYLVTQFVPGESLRALLHRVGPLAPPDAMNLVAQAARALHVAHGIGVLHRDLTPSNLLVRPDGRLQVSDFGLAALLAADRTAPAGSLADIYALGIVAYVCLTLTEPFPTDDRDQLTPTDAHQDPPPLPPHIPDAVRQVVMRALARDPRSRWLSAEAMGAAAATAVAPLG
jgi:serine/threonine-protein kinase